MAQQPVNVPAPTPPPNPAMYSNPVSIIGPQYCLPYPVDLAVVRKFMTLADGSFTVTDINDNIMFKVKEKHFSLHDKRTLLDPAGNPVVTITEKLFSAHEKHSVFRGASTDAKDLLFTVGASSVLQLKTTLNVFWQVIPNKRFVILRSKAAGQNDPVLFMQESPTQLLPRCTKRKPLEATSLTRIDSP
ncbi:hypothetical protein CISIN_1g029811mg [Citrus sinensis]|uniref:Uncharacterized protein n=1 Tax=Citrus sinensis TaxID=2711 RepID=A0A067FIN6_CITSI|nr:hypothetical protein CISIN_1g029811mg [Citrus sinensis]